MSGLITPEQMTYVEKSWGHELWICNNEKYCGKKLFIRKGEWLSFHNHKIKDEVLFVESGKINMNYGIDENNVTFIEMNPGYAFHVEPGLYHQMHALEDTLIIEFSTQHFDSDSYRLTRDLVVKHEAT